jgi:protein-S-isoprenylcysteine O-methyltransferase Ste14
VIAWLNVIVLLLSALLTLYFYVKSVGPAALEREIGEAAYRRCARYRVVASVFMTIALINYVVYVFCPLPISLPRTFAWGWPVSIAIAILIAIPAGYVWFRGMKDAGKETMVPQKGHTLYGGIYTKIRHPQALGECPYWWVIAFMLNSPFLVLISFIWVPIFLAMCWAEEKDLVIRYGEPYIEYRERTGFFFPKSRE